MEVIDTNVYNMVLGNDWLQRARAVIDYDKSIVIVKDNNRETIVNCRSTVELILHEEIIEEEEESDDDDDDEEEEDEELFAEDSETSLVVTEEESPDQHFYK